MRLSGFPFNWRLRWARLRREKGAERGRFLAEVREPGRARSLRAAEPSVEGALEPAHRLVALTRQLVGETDRVGFPHRRIGGTEVAFEF